MTTAAIGAPLPSPPPPLFPIESEILCSERKRELGLPKRKRQEQEERIEHL